MQSRAQRGSGRFAAVGFFCWALAVALLATVPAAPLARAAEQTASLAGPDLFFEENRGQFPDGVAYVARGSDHHIVLDANGASYDLGPLDGDQRIRVLHAGGRTPAAVIPAEPLPGRVHYFLGNDPQRWVTGASTWGRVRLHSVYEGIDVVYRAHGTRAEYDFVIAPGADPAQIDLRFEGADAVAIDPQGRLVIRTGNDVLLTAPPIAYQSERSERRAVDVAFAAIDDEGIGFRLGSYDPALELVIDPVILEYSTSLGGSLKDVPTGLQVGSDGMLYVSGRTLSADFQGGSGALAGAEDIFVSRISADGSTLLYTTFIGGRGGEFPLDLAVNAAGDAFVVTQTPSSNFPTVDAFDSSLGGAMDYAIVRLDGSGTLTYSSYYGGPDEEGAFDDGGLALAPNGDAYITGRTLSLPPNGIDLENEYQDTCTSQCAFVAGFDTSASGASSFVYGSYVGGNADDGGQDIDTDASGKLYVFGFTDSISGLVDAAQAFQSVTNNAGNQDNFLVVLDTSLVGSAQRVYSSYIGSPGAEAEPRGAVFVESASAVYLTGATDGAADTTVPYSAGFPIKNAVQSSPGGMEDAYVAKIDTSTTGTASLLFSTFLGGTATESGSAVITDSAGTISVALNFSSWTDTVAPLAEFAGFTDVRLVQLDSTAQSIETAVPLPAAFRLAVDANDRLLVVGEAMTSFPEVLPLPPSPAGGTNVFLARFESLPLSGATLAVDATHSTPGANEEYSYLFELTNNGSQDITDFSITGGFPGGLTTLLSALCFGVITCEPADPSDFSGSDAITPNERLTLFARASSASTGSFDITSLTATTTPADPDPSDNSDGTDVDVVSSPPASTALEIADFDAFGMSADTGGFAIDTPRGILATGNGVLDETANFMVFDRSMPIFVDNLYSRGRLAIGVVERSTWTPSNGDATSLLDIDSGFGTVDRVYVEIELLGRGPVVEVELRSGNAGSASVTVPGATTEVGLDPDKAFDIVVDTGLETATVTYGGDTILAGSPFSTVLVGGADVGDVGDDMVISIGNGRLDLGGASFNDQPLPEPSLTLGLASGLVLLAALHRTRQKRAGALGTQ